MRITRAWRISCILVAFCYLRYFCGFNQANSTEMAVTTQAHSLYYYYYYYTVDNTTERAVTTQAHSLYPPLRGRGDPGPLLVSTTEGPWRPRPTYCFRQSAELKCKSQKWILVKYRQLRSIRTRTVTAASYESTTIERDLCRPARRIDQRPIDKSIIDERRSSATDGRR